MSEKVVLSARRVALILALVALALTALSGVAQSVSVVLGLQGSWVLPLFFVGKDESVPSWYSSVLLLSCSGLLAAIALYRRSAGERRVSLWWLLAVVFLYLSVDEGVSIHEKLGPVGEATLGALDVGPEGFVSRAWVVPGIIFVLALLPFLVGFLWDLPPRVRLLSLASGLLYVGGAVGLELLNDVLVYLGGGVRNLGVAENVLRTVVIPHIEEFVEMVGVIGFVYALLVYAAGYVEAIEVETSE